MLGPAALALVLIVLFTAPLALLTYPAVRRSGTLWHLTWFGGLALLLLSGLVAGVIALVGRLP